MLINVRKLKKFAQFLKKEFPSKERNEIRIYFENNFEDWLCLMLGKFLVAKGIQDKTNGKVFAIKQRKDMSYENLCEGMGFCSQFFYEDITWKDKILANGYAVLFCCLKNDGKNILKLNYKGVHIGDLVYDYLIRMCKNTIYTLEKITTKEQFRLLKECFLYAIYFNNYFKKHKPDYFIAGDIVYLNGIIVRTAMKYNAKIIEFCTGKYIYELTQNEMNNYTPNYHSCCVKRIEEYQRNGLGDNWKEEVEKKIKTIFSGIGDWNTKEAYFGKKTTTKESLLKSLNINNKKKNIVIMAHCFSDSPHNGGDFIYSDYYQWLKETLKIVKGLDNVNWILKAHPCRKYYGEEGVVERLFEENKSESLFWMSDEYSSQMVPIIADALVTVSGTGGIEFSCCGIPCINVGNPFYSYFGFTINIKSEDQYKWVLKHMHRVRKLNDKQIQKAKEILYVYSQITGFSNDSLQKLFNEFYYEYRKKKNTFENNNQMIDALLEWKKKNLFTDSEIYQKGYEIGAV